MKMNQASLACRIFIAVSWLIATTMPNALGADEEIAASEEEVWQIVEELSDEKPSIVGAGGLRVSFPKGTHVMARNRDAAIPILIREFGKGNGLHTANIAWLLRLLEVAEVKEKAKNVLDQVRERRQVGDQIAEREILLLLRAIAVDFEKISIEELEEFVGGRD